MSISPFSRYVEYIEIHSLCPNRNPVESLFAMTQRHPCRNGTRTYHLRSFPRTICTLIMLFTRYDDLENYRSHRFPDQMREFKHLVSYNANRIWYNVAQPGRPSTSIHKKALPGEPMESGELSTEQHARQMYEYAVRGDGSLGIHCLWKTDSG